MGSTKEFSYQVFVTICVVGTRLTVVCDMSRHEHITGNTSTTYEPAEEEKIFPLKSGSLFGKGNAKAFR